MPKISEYHKGLREMKAVSNFGTQAMKLAI